MSPTVCEDSWGFYLLKNVRGFVFENKKLYLCNVNIINKKKGI